MTRKEFREDAGIMPEQHMKFLVSVKKGGPDWSHFDMPGVKNLPAVRWKLENLAKLPNVFCFSGFSISNIGKNGQF